MKALLATLLTATLWACGSSSGDSDRAATISALTGNAADGKANYESTCATCHGSDGKSGSEGRNITSVSKDEAIDQILNGGGSMPAYDDFSDQEIADLAAYVTSL